MVDSIELSLKHSDVCSGETFNICNGEPRPFREICSIIYSALGWNVELKSIPYPVAFAQAALTEWAYKVFAPGRQPPISRYAIGLASTTQTLSIEKARRILGYVPKLPLEVELKAAAGYYLGRK